MKKRNVVTQKPIMKTKTVVILIVILIISAILGIYKFCRDYQKEQENIPELYFYDAYGTETKLIPVEYSWDYKGNVSNYKDDNYLKKDYSEQIPAYINCTAWLYCTARSLFLLQIKVRIVWNYTASGWHLFRLYSPF